MKGLKKAQGDQMSTIKTNVDDDLKAASESIFRQMGMDMSGAIRMFLSQVVMHRGLPFEVKVVRPLNQETLRAIADSYSGNVEAVDGGVAAMLAELED
jgi:DNA-damage-inducible protein J